MGARWKKLPVTLFIKLMIVALCIGFFFAQVGEKGFYIVDNNWVTGIDQGGLYKGVGSLSRFFFFHNNVKIPIWHYRVMRTDLVDNQEKKSFSSKPQKSYSLSKGSTVIEFLTYFCCNLV
jgi:hypothetical protein